MTTRPFPSHAASCWTALAAAASALLLAASLHAAEPDYTSLAGVKGQGFQKWLDEARDQGFEPVYVNGFDVGDHAEFAGVAVKDPLKREFAARFNMTDDEYQDWFRDMRKKKGWRPTLVSGYMAGKRPRFAAVFVKDEKPFPYAWAARHAQSQSEYEKEVARQREAGLDPHCVTAYQDPDGAVRYTSLFNERAAGDQWESRIGMSDIQVHNQFVRWQEQGFRPADIYAYDTPDGLRFLACAQKRENEPYVWQARHDMSGDKYQKEFDKMGADGYRPGCICGYSKDGEVRFAAIWIKKK